MQKSKKLSIQKSCKHLILKVNKEITQVQNANADKTISGLDLIQTPLLPE